VAARLSGHHSPTPAHLQKNRKRNTKREPGPAAEGIDTGRLGCGMKTRPANPSHPARRSKDGGASGEVYEDENRVATPRRAESNSGADEPRALGVAARNPSTQHDGVALRNRAVEGESGPDESCFPESMENEPGMRRRRRDRLRRATARFGMRYPNSRNPNPWRDSPEAARYGRNESRTAALKQGKRGKKRSRVTGHGSGGAVQK
jgi:hypothetical protein